MTAPSPSRYSAGWYRSGARKRPVSVKHDRRMSDLAWANSSRLITGLVLYTGLGWLLSRWLGHQELLMAVGAMVGLGLSYYLMFRSLAAEQDRERNAELNTAGDTSTTPTEKQS